MAAKTFLKRVKLELPTRFRKTRSSRFKNEKPVKMCANCRCVDFEDWFECHDKK